MSSSRRRNDYQPMEVAFRGELRCCQTQYCPAWVCQARYYPASRRQTRDGTPRVSTTRTTSVEGVGVAVLVSSFCRAIQAILRPVARGKGPPVAVPSGHSLPPGWARRRWSRQSVIRPTVLDRYKVVFEVEYRVLDQRFRKSRNLGLKRRRARRRVCPLAPVSIRHPQPRRAGSSASRQNVEPYCQGPCHGGE